MPMKVYINLPNSRFTIHHDLRCIEIQKRQKAGQRFLRVRPSNVNRILSEFLQGKHVFRAYAAKNDMWLDVRLRTPQHDRALIYVLQLILSAQYKRFVKAHVVDHIC